MTQLGSKEGTYLVANGAKLLGAKLLKVLAQVLERKVGAHEDAVDFSIWARQLRQPSFLLELLDPLKQALQGKA